MSWHYQPLLLGAPLLVDDGADATPMTASTNAYLRSFDAANVAFVLVFEGYDLAYTTHQDVTGIASALSSATGGLWSNVKGGLEYPGKIPSSLDMFDAKIEAGSAAFSVIDHDDSLIRLLSRQADDSIARTEQTVSIDSNDTTIPLADASAFAASGTAYDGLEQLTYSGKTSTSLTGVTRGKRSLFYTASGIPFEFGVPHTVDSDTGETGSYRPLVTSEPRTWFNRQVALYLCHREGTSWSAPTSTAKILWVGRLKNWNDSGDGRVRLETVSVLERLSTTLLANQYKGKIAEGLYFTTQSSQMRITMTKFVQGSPATIEKVESTYQTIAGAGGYQTHEQLASAIDGVLHTLFNAAPGTIFSSTMRMTLTRRSTDAGLRYEFELLAPTVIATDTWKVQVWLARDVWRLLGWSGENAALARDPSGFTVAGRDLSREQSTTTFQLVADGPALRHMVSAETPPTSYMPKQITTTSISGTSFTAQSSVPDSMNIGAPTGFLRLGNAIFPVNVASTSGDTTTFNLCGAPVGGFLIREGVDAAAGSLELAKLLFMPDDQNAEDLVVQQVWVETGALGEILLKLLVSTGTVGFNHPIYDYFAEGMGAGIPWTLIDANSWLSLGRHAYLLLIEKPTPLRTLIESALKVTGHYCIFKDGAVTITTVGEEWPGATRLVALTESNKAQVVRSARETVTSPAQISYSPDGIINRMTLRFNRSLDGKFNREVTVNAKASQTDHAQTRANIADAYGFYEIDGFLQSTGLVAWQSDVAATALAYFSRPLAQIERTFDFPTATRLYPGARVSIVDNRIIDARTGLRGVTAQLGWCVKADVDWRTGVGEGTFIYAPDLAAVRLGAWAPSARVDETANTGGFTNGYDAATKRLKLKQHEYSLSTEDKDLVSFSAGDRVRWVQLDPVHPHNGLSGSDTVASVDEANDYITLTAGATGFPSTGNFVLEFDDALTVTSAQLATSVFLAAPTTLTTGVASRDAKLYGGREAEKPDTAISYSPRYGRHRLADDDAGEPFSVHKVHELMDTANGLFGGYDCPQPVCWQHAVGAYSTTGSTSFELLAGPLFVPLRVPTRRLEVLVSARIYQGAVLTAAGDGTVRVRSSILPAKGTDSSQPWLGVAYLDGNGSFVDLTIDNSAGTNWQHPIGDLVAATPSYGGKNIIGIWLTVEAKVLNGTDRINLRGLTVREKAW